MDSKAQMRSHQNSLTKNFLEGFAKTIPQLQDLLLKVEERIKNPQEGDHKSSVLFRRDMIKKALEAQIEKEKDLKTDLTIC